MSEINLGIGREEGIYQGITREWLYWYDQQGKRYLTAEETIVATQQHFEAQLQQERLAKETISEQLQQEREAKEIAEQKAKHLEQLLREAGINLDDNSQA